MSQSAENALQNLLSISSAIAGQLDHQSVLQCIEGELTKIFHHDHMDIVILTDADEYIVYEVGLRTEWGDKLRQPGPISKSPIRSVLSGEAGYLLTGDALTDERFHFSGAWDSPIYDANLRSRIHVPMYIHGRVMGSLNISSQKKNLYGENDLEVAEQIAAILAPYMYALVCGEKSRKAALAEGVAVEREKLLRLGALRLTEGMEKARQRIGMDLHDQTLADITRISRHFSRIKRLAGIDIQEASLLDEDISSCIRELRRIIENTKPGVLELFGFTQAVEAQLERSISGVLPKIVTQVVDETNSLLDSAPESVRTTAYRIVQEAINNSIKHGNPTEICIRLILRQKVTSIEIEDNGSGELANSKCSTGGLDNMRVRAALISSELFVEQRSNSRGIRVSLHIPLAELKQSSEVSADSQTG